MNERVNNFDGNALKTLCQWFIKNKVLVTGRMASSTQAIPTSQSRTFVGTKEYVTKLKV